MEILSKEDLLMQKEGLRRNKEIDDGKMKGFKVPIYSVEMFISTALAIYDKLAEEKKKNEACVEYEKLLISEGKKVIAENEKMKAGIEKLMEKWNKELRDYPYPDTRGLLHVFLNDLSALCGKEEK
jgi:hypothetical protein